MDLGQHFMIDEDLLKRVVLAAKLQENDFVLEIGPGKGALTKILREMSINVITIEIDTQFEADIHANALDILEKQDFDILVSNIPYQISEPLFSKLSILKIRRIVVVVGKRFANLIEGESILGSIIRESYTIEHLEDIAPSAFDPPPRVQSSLIRLERREKYGILHDFYAYSKSKVKNYLKTKLEKRVAMSYVQRLPQEIQDKRLYSLNTEDFLKVKELAREMEDGKDL